VPVRFLPVIRENKPCSIWAAETISSTRKGIQHFKSHARQNFGAR